MCMSFPEFVEAVARVAEKLEIPHPLDEVIDAEEVAQEDLKRYGARPLHDKIEILLLMIAKNCLKSDSYETHQEVLQ